MVKSCALIIVMIGVWFNDVVLKEIDYKAFSRCFIISALWL